MLISENLMRYGWSIEIHQWDRLLMTIGGTNWKHVTLDPLYRDNVPEGPGVYAICARPKISAITIINHS